MKTPCYFISTIEDHIAPWKSTPTSARPASGPSSSSSAAPGHIAGIDQSAVGHAYSFWTNETLPESRPTRSSPARRPAPRLLVDRLAAVDRRPQRRQKVAVWVPAQTPPRTADLEDAPGAFVRFRLDMQKKVA